jgi:hypothetical protein
MMRLVLTVTFMLHYSRALRVTNVTGHEITQADVDGERKRLNTMAVALEGLVKGESMSHSKIAPSIKLFANNLETVLASSKAMKPNEAMKQLMAAKAGVASLVNEMNAHQERLMKENVDSQDEVLLGVLMTHKGDSMGAQLEILKSPDFSGLDVAKALTLKHDDKTALYLQAAEYLDAHKNASGTVHVLSDKERAAKVEAVAASFEARVTALEHQLEVRRIEHKKSMDRLAARSKTGDTHAKSRMHHEERQFKKYEAMEKTNIAHMKEAVVAMRKGDMKALQKAQDAISASLRALTDKNAGMLVFLQKGTAYLERDCPFCVAQCVGKCHDSGKAYTTCLTECADAGK